ncbi:hypothetical protein LV84_01431 [Algoriphagus ratkowskyi]|uniref:Uncharacterized protein n=1 Tax=Algoriphagus ratkowskyi TaxID=57028 RepID=A0A2W7RSC0_9BACT|nr:hypothetical protein LV84_01431 [Algoriphagus ratkowskyi]
MKKTYTRNTTKIKPSLKQGVSISGTFIVPKPVETIKKQL